MGIPARVIEGDVSLISTHGACLLSLAFFWCTRFSSAQKPHFAANDDCLLFCYAHTILSFVFFCARGQNLPEATSN